MDAGGASGFTATSMTQKERTGKRRWNAVTDVEREKTGSARAFLVDYLFFVHGLNEVIEFVEQRGTT